jgi:hypothetical protein
VSMCPAECTAIYWAFRVSLCLLALPSLQNVEAGMCTRKTD